jgi:hypothetical protein
MLILVLPQPAGVCAGRWPQAQATSVKEAVSNSTGHTCLQPGYTFGHA